MADFVQIIKGLCAYSSQKTWVVLQTDHSSLDTIAKNISAIANVIAYEKRPVGFLIWGINDKTHEITGTTFNRHNKIRENLDIVSWLQHSLSSNALFSFHDVLIDNKKVVILQIFPAYPYPVTFKKDAYIYWGNDTKHLNDLPTLQSDLWAELRQAHFEELLAKENLTQKDVLNLLLFHTYCDKLHIPASSTHDEIIRTFEQEKIIQKQNNGLWSITNLGALLLAKDFHDFPHLATHSIRIIQYQDASKAVILKQKEFHVGYATSLPQILDWIDAVTPSQEPIASNGLRTIIRAYSTVTIRELVVNALMHQDFTANSHTIFIEIFSNRIEITNPGSLCMEPRRIVDTSAQSHNPLLAKFLRRMQFCEELGSGWDRSIMDCELHGMPSPTIATINNQTRAVIYTKSSFAQLDTQRKLWNCYCHATIEHLQGRTMNNRSLRERFHVSEKNRSQISRLIKEAQHAKLIKPVNPEAAPRHMAYVPYWA